MVSSSYDVDLLKVHDYFNIISLPVIILNNWIYLLYGNIFGFDILFYLFLGYIIIDLIWLVIKPQAVGSPSTIVFHHIISILGWFIPIYEPSLLLLTRLALLVEFNTWFNILKRYYKYDIIYICFYITWFLFRVILYPILFYLSYNQYILFININGSYFNIALPLLLICSCLTSLNLLWTYELVVKKGYLGVKSN